MAKKRKPGPGRPKLKIPKERRITVFFSEAQGRRIDELSDQDGYDGASPWIRGKIMPLLEPPAKP